MRISGFVVVLASSLALLPRAARADEISLGVGFGGGAQLGGDFGRAFDAEAEVGGRFTLGLRRGNTAVETSFFGSDVHQPAGMDGSHSTLTLGAGLKQYVPVVRHVELYGRAGVDYTWLVPCPGKPGMPPTGFDGVGFDYGVGVELGWRKRVPEGRLDSIGVVMWLDAGRQHFHLENEDAKPLDGTLGAVNLGFSFLAGY